MGKSLEFTIEKSFFEVVNLNNKSYKILRVKNNIIKVDKYSIISGQCISCFRKCKGYLSHAKVIRDIKEEDQEKIQLHFKCSRCLHKHSYIDLNIE